MTTETRKRIRAYKRMLPELRERVIAVALLLAMSVSMLGTASYAWLTISRRPEVTGANTTIAANGNLEIALATGEREPDESKVGDSSAAEGQSVANSNLTWGNMINLSDSSYYGLDELVLRPAMLNDEELLTRPLWGAEYSTDGRITQMNSNFGYSSWKVDPVVGGRFVASDEIGVRAVSSMIYDQSSGNATMAIEQNKVKDKNLSVQSKYVELANNKSYMNSLATMMGLYMTARMNPSHETYKNPDCNVEDIANLAGMYNAFREVMYLEAEAIASLINYVQMYREGANNYTPVTADQVLDPNSLYDKNNDGRLDTVDVAVTRLSELQKDYKTVSSDYLKLMEISSSGTTLKWSDSGLNAVVNNLVDVGKCTIGKDDLLIGSMGATDATGFLSGTHDAKITNGILYRFEERTGGHLVVRNLKISASIYREVAGIPIDRTEDVTANVFTTAPTDYFLFDLDLSTAISDTGGMAAADLIAQDTYGLVVDFWLRTNALSSYLVLEGNLLAQREMVEAFGKDQKGNEVPLYTVTETTTDDAGTVTNRLYDVYEGKVPVIDETTGERKEVDGWLSAETHTPFELLEGMTPVRKMVEEVTVLGYEGVNRVWDGTESMLSPDATTQGSGSCYVYYADTPEDQARSLKLLEAFNVAFVSSTGKLLATAKMNTEYFYADSGRVTVPLYIDSYGSIPIGYDEDGNEQYAITELQQNTPTRITAIVYLDGSKLTNKEVLAAADIQGQLNIQFGTTVDMKPIKNQDLASKSLSVSASVDKNSFDWDSATDDMTSEVTLLVEGAEPNQVTAFFQRSINATQGSREKTMTFTKNADGKWVSRYQFTAPGEYVLRTVQLDGVDYTLKETPRVKVSGFAVSYVSCEKAVNQHLTIRSAENSATRTVRLKFVTEDISKMPRRVQGHFAQEDGTLVNVEFTYNATTQEWTGPARFLTSGEYTMQYLILDGKYVELDSDLWHTASVTLGMRVEVFTTSPHTFKYAPSEWKEEENSNKANLFMQVRILDNTGKEMRNFSTAKLTYAMKGSNSKKMDTDLQWDGKYFSGAMANGGAGIWEFHHVTVDGDELTNDLRSPVFTIQPPEPPEYHGHGTVAYQYRPDNSAQMNVQITNSGAASVAAWLQKADGTGGQWVTGRLGSEINIGDDKTANNWFFTVPVVAGSQDGNWELTKLRIWDVLAEDGTLYTEDSPLEWDMSSKNNVAKVVAKLSIVFTGGSKDFGKDNNGVVTGDFLESYDIPDLSVTISDFEGNLQTTVTDVQLKFEYNGGSATNGGYTADHVNNAQVSYTITMDQQNGTTFTKTNPGQLLYAGNYKTTLSFKVNGEPVSYSGNDLTRIAPSAPQYSVWSLTPIVEISAISPTGTFDVDTVIGDDGHRSATVPPFTKTEATVYFKCSRSGDGSTCNPYRHNYSGGRPSVTIKLSNMGNAAKAVLSFGSGVHVYNNTTQTDGFEWTADTTCTRNIGDYRSNTAANDSKTPAGTITTDKLVLTAADGSEYDVAISAMYGAAVSLIKINNPY